MNSLGFCNTLEILGDGFLEMDGHWWSCLHMIFILYFETIKGWFILKVKIPSEMKVAPRYALLTLSLLHVLHCSNTALHARLYELLSKREWSGPDG